VSLTVSFIRRLINQTHLRLGTPLTNNHNVRSARLRFWIPHAGVLQYVLDLCRLYGKFNGCRIVVWLVILKQ
jgi:hypothetical protein